jgi:hypothetical protein
LALVVGLLIPTAATAKEPCSAANYMTGCAATTTADFRGAIIVPGSAAANAEVARSGGCDGCEWTLVLNCDENDVVLNEWVHCNGAKCPDGSLFRLYLQRPGDAAPAYVDSVCLTADERIVDADDLAADVERYLTSLSPPEVRIRVQPGGPSVTGLATFFRADGPVADRTALDVTTAAGPARLVIEIAPHEYRWEFGDGATCVTSAPGGGYDGGDATGDRCDERVAHPYATPGEVAVRLTTTWRGTYTFDVGFGPVGPRPVPGSGVAGPVATRRVTVRQARAELVGR